MAKDKSELTSTQILSNLSLVTDKDGDEIIAFKDPVTSDTVLKMRDIPFWNDLIGEFKRKGRNRDRMTVSVSIEQISSPKEMIHLLYSEAIRAYLKNKRKWTIDLNTNTILARYTEILFRNRQLAPEGYCGVDKDAVIALIDQTDNLLIEFLQFITGDYVDVKQCLIERIESDTVDVTEDGHKVTMHIYHKELLERIGYLVQKRLNNNTLHIITGYAGSGKSTQSLMKIHPQQSVVYVALCNTVPLELYNKFKTIHCIEPTGEPMSVARYRFEKDATKYSILVIDEFSQWSLTEADVLLKALMNHNEIYILGDINQCRPFTGRGSLFGAVLKASEGQITTYNEIKRTSNPELLQKYYEYLKDHDASVFNTYNIEKLDVNDFIDANSIMISGSNNSVLRLNIAALRCLSDDENDKETLTEILNQLGTRKASSKSLPKTLDEFQQKLVFEIIERICGSGKPLKLYSNVTKVLDEKAFKAATTINDKFNYKLLRNDVLRLQEDDGQLRAKLQRANGGTEILVDNSESFWKLFSLGYAITAFKSQGLEWSNVCIINIDHDLPLRSFESTYVAVTRTKYNLSIYNHTNGGANSFYNKRSPEAIINHFSLV